MKNTGINSMSKYKRGHQQSVDKNELEIIKALEALGYTVQSNHDDILMGRHFQTYWIELKNGNPFNKNGTLKKGFIKDSQYEILCTWSGQYNICWGLEQILNTENLHMERDVNISGINKANFTINLKKWLTPSELNRLRQLPWWNLDG